MDGEQLSYEELKRLVNDHPELQDEYERRKAMIDQSYPLPSGGVSIKNNIDPEKLAAFREQWNESMKDVDFKQPIHFGMDIGKPGGDKSVIMVMEAGSGKTTMLARAMSAGYGDMHIRDIVLIEENKLSLEGLRKSFEGFMNGIAVYKPTKAKLMIRRLKRKPYFNQQRYNRRIKLWFT